MNDNIEIVEEVYEPTEFERWTHRINLHQWPEVPPGYTGELTFRYVDGKGTIFRVTKPPKPELSVV